MDIPEEIKEQVKKELSGISKKVTLKVFTDDKNCDYCKDTLELTRAVAELSDLVSVVEYKKSVSAAEIEQYNVEMTPAILVHSEEKDWPIRFYGIPSGYEFSSLIESIHFAGTGTVDLPADVVTKLKAINKPVSIKSFVTVSCPYCPAAVTTAFKFAMINPEFITAQMVEASQFPEVSNKFQVRAVPKVVINEAVNFEGSLPVAQYLEKVLQA